MTAMTKQARSDLRKKVLAHLKKQGYDTAYVPLGSDSHKTPMEVISTGSIVLDKVLGCGGLPRGRIVEIFGPESVGKCVTYDTLVHTPGGLLTVGEIFDKQGLPLNRDQSEVPVSYPLLNRYKKPEETTHFTYNGQRTTYTVRTQSGTEIRSTANHPYLVMSEGGYWVWRTTNKLQPGDYLVCARQLEFGSVDVDLDEAYMLGLLIADGGLTEPGCIGFTNDDPSIKQFAETRMAELLGVSPRQYDNNEKGSIQYRYNSVDRCGAFFDRYRLHPTRSAGKEFGPVARCFKADALRDLLRGYFDCECYIDTDRYYIEVASASHQLLEQTKLLLLRFGILSQLKRRDWEYKGQHYSRLTLTGAEARKYAERIGTRSKLRQVQLDAMMANPCSQGSTNFDSIPHCNMLLRDLYDASETSRTENKLAYDYMGEDPTARLTYNRLGMLLAALDGSPTICARLQEILDADYFYDPVVEITENPEQELTYDFAMSSTASFIAQGVVTHNTTLGINLCIEAQKDGGYATYIDFEHAVHLGYAQAMGLDLSDDAFGFFQPDHFEMGAQIAYDYVKTVKSDIVIIDSVTAMLPKRVFESGPEDPSKGMGLQARLMSNFLNLISKELSATGTVLVFINQMRSNIKTSKYDPGPDWITSGGKSLPYYATVRLRLKPGKVEKARVMNQITGEMEEIPVSNFVRAEGYKNKVGFPKRTGEFVIRYGEGIDNVRSILDVAERHRIIKKNASFYQYKKPGEPGHFKEQGVERTRKYLQNNPDVFNMVMDDVSEKLSSYNVSKVAELLSDDDLTTELRNENEGEEDIVPTPEEGEFEEDPGDRSALSLEDVEDVTEDSL